MHTKGLWLNTMKGIKSILKVGERMNKWKCIFSLSLAIVLMGCEEETVVEQVDVPVVEEKQEETEKPQQEIEQKPVIVELVDSSTSEVIHTIKPTELEFETDRVSYQQTIEKLARNLARGTEDAEGYDRRMVLDRLDDQGNIVKGSPLILLRERVLVERILAASVEGGKVELPIDIIESDYDPEDVPYLDEVVVATYTTYFNPAESGRNKNIELSALAINNVIIGSGDYFSFNTVVGPRDEANGYQPAPEIVNKELVMGIGGGVCQTSSTLFNAVDQLPVNYVERHHHSLDIGYVPKGRDATVSYGGLDFKFQNTSEVPFLIKTIYNKNSLTIEFRTSQKHSRVGDSPRHNSQHS